MATLEKIRNRAGLLVVVVGLALFAFIIGDFLRSGSTFFNQSKEKIAVVDGEAINIRDFQTKVEEYTEIYKSRSRGETPNETVQTGIRQSVFDNMVNDIILKEETEKIGMTISKAELSDLIMGDNISPMIQQMPDFVNPNTGVFDKTLLLNFLQIIESDNQDSRTAEERAQIESAKKYWLFWEQNVKRQRVESKYTTLLSKAINMNSLDAKAAFENTKESMDFDYIVQLYNSVPDDQVSVSDSEIEKLYNQRKEAYKQEAGKLISFIAVNIEPSKEDFEETRKIVSELKPEFTSEVNVGDMVNLNSDVKYVDAFKSASELQPELKEFVEHANVGDVEGPILLGNTYRMFKLVAKTVAPDSIQASQLMLPANNDEARLKVVTDSLIGVLKGGKAFAALAAEATNGQTTGEMGWITETGLAAAADVKFKDEVFNTPLNQPVVIKSSFGTHLVQVTGKTTPVTKYKVAEIQMAVTPSTKTYNKLYNDLNLYVSKNNSLEKFKAGATESGYVCQNDVTLEQNQATLANIANSRQVIRWAFEHEKGKISDIFECDDRFIVAALESDLQKGYRPLKSVSDILKRELLNDKKAEKLISDLKAKNLSSVSQYAEATNTNVQNVKYVTFETANISGIGREPAINAQVLQSKVGGVYGPLKGLSGVYVLGVTEKHTSENQFNLEVQKRTWEASSLYRLMYQFVPTLKEKAKIEDNRIRFY